MLILIFTVGEQQYALNTDCIVEILPLLNLQKVHGTSGAIAGLFNYQSRIVPVIDVNYLLEEEIKEPTLSQRIILLKESNEDHSAKLFGLLVEKIIETTSVSPSDIKSDAEIVNLFENPYLGEMFLNQDKVIQCIRAEHILSDQQYESLLAGVQLEGING